MALFRPHAFGLALAATVLLAACGGAPDDRDPLSEMDSTVARALNDQLLSDPDLASINEANAALTRSGDNSLPLDVETAEAIRAAQDQAIALLGGTTKLVELPDPDELSAESEESPFVLLETTVGAMSGAERCLSSTRTSAVWAARLPEALPVFPRGAVQEAFGVDQSGCALRAVRFRSAVPREDIARFYYGRAKKGGYTVTYQANDSGWLVSGQKGEARFAVRSRPSLLGHSEIDLVTIS